MVQNKSLVFKAIPKEYPVPGKDLVVETSEIDLNSPPTGGLITKNLYVSFDPYQRGRMRDASIKSYSPPMQLNNVVDNTGVAEVLASDHPDFKKGDIVFGWLGTENYSAVPKEAMARFKKIDNKYNLPLSNYTGALGMAGLTAYSSYYKIGQPKKGETIFISAASGAVGAVVGQLAKHDGLRVVGSAGSDAKVDYLLKELKFDAAFNYKTTSPKEALKKYCPDGLDIYYENVGGETLEAAIDAMNIKGRIIVCGMISVYNLEDKSKGYYPKNLYEFFQKRLKMEGFIVGDSDTGPVYAKEHQENVSKWLSEGSFIAKEDIVEGVENAAEGLLGIFHGKNFGKACLKLKHDE